MGRLLRSARHDSRGKPSLALLAAVTALAFCALHMVVPALPVLVAVFDDSAAHVQLVLSLYLAGIAAGQLIYGPVSDRFGRRPVLIAGLAMFLLGTLLCGVAWSLRALIFGRVLQALGACAGIVLSRAIIRDVYDREMAARGLALVMMAMTLAPAVSPALGAYLTEWLDWRAIFVLLGGFGAAVFAGTAAWLGETNRYPAPLDFGGMTRSYAILLRSPAFAWFALCSACTSASWFTLYRERSVSGFRSLARAAQYLRAHDPVPDGNIYAGQCRGGSVRATHRQSAAADYRPRRGVKRRDRGAALVHLRRVQRLGIVPADCLCRDW
ncbi:MAG: MFS transporter [Alphaproteobacteria bacterium]|nr:MFS transporter [Alphaproteobacteria bacterium]MBV9154268.1 MFS transporter [Alphaproteobacteria bacterium]MBV9584894.1 MFS transporter [Alphaproteobacteria bacterium]